MKKGSLFAVILFLISGCSNCWNSQPENVSKLYIDLSMLDSQGLYGPPDGLRSLAYEFCIPRSREKLQQVQMIDVKAQVYGQSPGRIGCDQQQWLIISDTHRPDYQQVLASLNRLRYIDKIVPVWFE